MFLITPTMLGSLIAGVAMWLMFWYRVNHVDSILYLNQYLTRKVVLDWVKRNPQTALLLPKRIRIHSARDAVTDIPARRRIGF